MFFNTKYFLRIVLKGQNNVKKHKKILCCLVDMAEWVTLLYLKHYQHLKGKCWKCVYGVLMIWFMHCTYIGLFYFCKILYLTVFQMWTFLWSHGTKYIPTNTFGWLLRVCQRCAFSTCVTHISIKCEPHVLLQA